MHSFLKKPVLSLTFNHYCFTPKWGFFAVFLVAFIGLLKLGSWQLNRAEEKRTLLAQYLAMQQAKAQSIESLQTVSPFQNVSAKGLFDNTHQILLDNRFHDHQFGYEVLTPLQLPNGYVILVNRGWIKGSPSRRVLPQIKKVGGEVALTGYAYFPSAKSWVLGEVIDNPGHWPMVIERIDIDTIRHSIGQKVYPFVLRLKENSDYGFTLQWKMVNMPPSKHIGYAFQWFVMAALLGVLFLGLNTKKRVDK